MKLLGTSMCAAFALAALAFAQDRGHAKDKPASGGDKPAKTGDKPATPADKSGTGSDHSAKGDDVRGGKKDTPTTDDDLAQQYFKTCDYDANGWITFSEAQQSLTIDRQGFAVYDVDNDGRISAEEFSTRFHAVIDHGGAFPPPLSSPDARGTKKRTAAELIQDFDLNKDGALDEHEIARALEDYGAHGVDAARILSSVDHDGSKKVESSEAQALLELLAPPSASDATKKKATTMAELFDQVEVRPLDRDQTPQPPRIIGPVTTFRRLDFDQSGAITVEDLEALQRPIVLPVRIRAVIAVLDTNGDGALSPEELDAALK